jgi:hypothetical protein
MDAQLKALCEPRIERRYIHPNWSPEEIAKMQQLLTDYPEPMGRGFRGLHRYLHPHFPGRTYRSLCNGIKRARRHGVARKRIRYDEYITLSLKPEEAAYLAAMIEAEGFVFVQDKVDGRRTTKCRNSRVPHIGLITNTYEALIDYVMSLVPFARKKKTMDGLRWGKKTVWQVVAGTRGGLLCVARAVFPYMRGAKAKKVQAILEEFGGPRDL